MSFVHRSSSQWFRIEQPRSRPLMRLFCFPFAGGGTLAFRPWVAELPTEIELIAANLPGREFRSKEASCTSIDQLVEALCEAIVPMLGTPYAMFGHSMGAILAYELSHKLQALGMPAPKLLIASAAAAPHLSGRDESGEAPSQKELLSMLKKLGGVPPEVFEHPEILDMFLPILRSDLSLLHSYEPQKRFPLKHPIVAYGGRADEIPEADLAAWQHCTSAPFALRMFDGNHFYHQEQSNQFLNELVKDVRHFCQKKTNESESK